MLLREFIENNNNIFKSIIKGLQNFTDEKVKTTLKSNFVKFTKFIKDNNIEDETLYIINKYFKTNYTDISQIKYNISESIINEDFKQYWETIKGEAFPTLSFYPALQVWLEIDKLIKSNGIVSNSSLKMIIIYGIFWLLLVSGKYVKQYMLNKGR